jgi:hypothetical protein
MRFFIIAMLFLSVFVGCANEDGSRKTTRLVVENVYKASEHSADCRRGLELSVTVKGRTYSTGEVVSNSNWDYELTQEKKPTPYTLDVLCVSDNGKRSRAFVKGEIPAKSDDVLLKGIVIGPPRIAHEAECEDSTPGAPCIQFQ